MKIELLGTGCARCEKLDEMVREAASELDVACEIVHVRDIAEIVARGVSTLPGLTIDGRIILSGRLPSKEELAGWLTSATG